MGPATHATVIVNVTSEYCQPYHMVRELANSCPREYPKKHPVSNSTEKQAPEDDTVDIAIEEDPPPVRALTTMEAAARLHMSPQWVKLHAREIGGRWTPRGYRFPAEITVETVKQKITLRHTVKTRGIAEQNEYTGDIARQVFAALDQGIPTRRIVQELRLQPEKVRALAEEWIKCGQFDENVLMKIHGR